MLRFAHAGGRIAGRAAAAKERPTVGLKRRLADLVGTVLRRTAAGHDVEQPRRPLLRAARPAGGEQRGPVGEDFSLYKEVGKGRVRFVLCLRGERHLGVGRDLDRAAAFGAVGEGEAAELHVVLG